MAAYQIPNWIQPAETANFAAKGFGLGASAGAEEAANRFRQQQLQLQAQKAAQDQAQVQAELGLRQAAEQQKAQQFAQDQALQQQHEDMLSRAAAQKSAAIMSYQNDIAAGVDPNEAILKHGPAMGASTAEAAVIRANQAGETARLKAATMPKDIQPKPYVDPETGVHFVYNPATGSPTRSELPRVPLEAMTASDRESLSSDRKLINAFSKATSDVDAKLYLKQNPEAIQEALDAADGILELKPKDPQALAIKRRYSKAPRGTSKVDRAHQIAAEHPDWTKQQVIDAVNAEGQ
jgi:hypothetical protein